MITADDHVIFDESLTANDPLQPVELDITGVLRLTLSDTRGSQDATCLRRRSP
ncbi:hypothetical protein KHQ06_25360 [Nocardia tengchongensis]|uniref:Uncharacterized protein n=1 Tax=Nocardia tengchongensis TaxID=2055889 RepID=A0ABX8CI83_9NOCA|nr:hypothetical protein [Nocardia tengchongensis]QVI19671.1 hypothetical protein KHQ06_25360 [Nocardia tengchongensis]